MRIAYDHLSVLIEGEEYQLELLAKFIRTAGMGNKPAWDLSQEQREHFVSVAADITRRIAEKKVVHVYHLYARGKRRICLGFKREPDTYLGKGYGHNFIEACDDLLLFSYGFNSRNNTYKGREIFQGEG